MIKVTLTLFLFKIGLSWLRYSLQSGNEVTTPKTLQSPTFLPSNARGLSVTLPVCGLSPTNCEPAFPQFCVTCPTTDLPCWIKAQINKWISGSPSPGSHLGPLAAFGPSFFRSHLAHWPLREQSQAPCWVAGHPQAPANSTGLIHVDWLCLWIWTWKFHRSGARAHPCPSLTAAQGKSYIPKCASAELLGEHLEWRPLSPQGGAPGKQESVTGMRQPSNRRCCGNFSLRSECAWTQQVDKWPR